VYNYGEVIKMIQLVLLNTEEIKTLLLKYWEDDFIVISEKVIRADELLGYGLVNDKNELVAFATYRVTAHYFEIVTLYSEESARGYGSKLMKALLNKANEYQLPIIEVTTTNDNTMALRLYQKFGFSIVHINFGAVDRARVIKPTIPLYDNQIRLEHEITLRLVLGEFK
jgi:ribosomal protein S18 acetylase RimI-like enzyme